MLIETFYYSAITASSVRFERGETHFIAPADPEKPCVGVLFVSGSWRLHLSGIESGPEDIGWHASNPDGTWPREFWNQYAPDDYCEGGPDGVSWVCFELNATGARTLSYAQLDGSLLLPAGSGLMIGSGSAAIGNSMSSPPTQPEPKEFANEDKSKVFRLYRDPVEIVDGTGGPLNYFSPSDVDRTILGQAQILLVR